MPKRGKRKSGGKPKDASAIDHGRNEQRAFDDEDALEEDEIEAFHSAKEKIGLMDDDDDQDSSDDEEEQVMALDDDDSDESDDGNDVEEDDSDAAAALDDDINEDFLAALKPRRRKIAKDDIVEGDEDADDKDLKRSLEGWGRDKAQFYDTNFIDPDYGTDSEDERMAAAEEEEALMLQQQQASALDEADFGLDESVVKPKTTKKARQSKATTAVATVEEIPKDFASMSLAERTKYVKRARPELAALQQLCQSLHEEKQTLLDPLLKHITSSTSVGVLRALNLPPGIHRYLEQRTALVATYAMTIASYLLLVAKETPGLEDHPIGEALLRLQEIVNETQEAHDLLVPRLEDALAAMAEGQDHNDLNTMDQRVEDMDDQQDGSEDDADNSDEAAEANVRQPRRKGKKAWHLAAEDEDPEDELAEGRAFLAQVQAAARQKKHAKFVASLPQDDGRDGDADGTRGVSYAIMKNKGLLPSRKKEYRNPRVRGRNKFKRATKRRKGQAVEAVKEVPKYRGEATGIKRTVTKSTKLS